MTARLFPPGVPISKRLFDLLLTIPGLLLASPLLLILVVLIRILHGKPIVFTQVRPGYKTEPFTMYKFRSMTDEKDEHGELLPDKDRVTKFGKFLRSSSLDELPELYNVLRGEMSLVGPRPLLMRYLGRYSAEQNRRHDVLPGITGWAQINGRNNVSWDIKFKLHVWYVDHQSIWLDIKVLFKTFAKVFTKEGINQSETVTMYEFMGSEGDEIS